VFLGIRGAWTPLTYTAPDLVTEFAIVPTLLGGAHMILSLALLVTGARLMWSAIAERSESTAWRAAAVIGILFLFHPYFVLLFGILFILSVLWSYKNLTLKKLFTLTLPFAICLLPTLLIYAPLYYDPIFRVHHLIANKLPIGGLHVWVATLFPFAIALAWRWRKRIKLQPNEYWFVAWIASAIIAMFFPVPWIRKLTEGLIVPLVLLTLPAWIAIRDWILIRPFKKLMAAIFFLAAGFGPLHLVSSQLVWISNPTMSHWFYRSTDVFHAWNYLHSSTSASSIIMSDDKWINIWTPAYAVRTVWVGHDHETPGFAEKRRSWQEFMTTSNPETAKQILDTAHVTHFMTTSPASADRFTSLLDKDVWNIEFHSGDVTIFQKRSL
jgi:hypothetical protein